MLLALIVLGLLSGLPDLARRVAAETADRYVELVADQTDFAQLAASSGQTPAQVLSALHAVGVNGLGVSEDTLQSLDQDGLVTALAGSQWLDALRAAGLTAPAAIDPTGTYAITSDATLAAFVQAGLAAAGGTPVARIALPGGRIAVGVPLPPSVAESLPLGFRPPSGADPGAFGLARSLGMDVVPRPETGLTSMSASQVQGLMAQISSAGVPVHSVLFAGASTQPVPGYPGALAATAASLLQNGWNLAVIETAAQRGNVDQPGTLQINNAMGQRTVRTYSVPAWMLAQYSEPQTVQAIVTSVRDRNLRLVYLHPYQVGGDLVARTVALYSDVATQLRADGFVLAPPRPFPAVTVPRAQRVLQTLAVVAAGLLLLELLVPGLRAWGYAPLAVLGVLGAGLAAGSQHMTQLLVPMAAASGFGGLAMCYAANLWNRWPAVPQPSGPGAGPRRRHAAPAPALATGTFGWVWTRGVAVSVVTSGITFAGAVIIATLLGDTTHFLEWQYFHGIKVTYLGIPFLAACAFAAFVGLGASRQEAGSGILDQVVWAGEQPVRYKHVAVLLFVALAGGIYLLRSGNVSSAYVPAIEQHMRTFLARTLPARPREKEFLVGYPSAFLAVLALSRRSRWWFLLFLLGISAGQVSVVDTFEHIRSPFALSVWREGIGLAVGIATGTAALVVAWAVVRVADRLRGARGGGAGPSGGRPEGPVDAMDGGRGTSAAEAGERTWPAS